MGTSMETPDNHMKELFLHIEYLLRHHTCLTLPGFGAFIVSTQDARWTQDGRVIIPSKQQITFNRAINHDDGILTKSYTRKYDISYNEAKTRVIHSIDSLLNDLRNNGRIKIGNIGTLTIGTEDNITFTPSLSIRSLQESLGYYPISLKDTPEERETIAKSPTTEIPVKDNRYYIFKIRKSVAHIAATFFIVLSLALTIVLNPLPQPPGLQKASVVPVETIISSISPQETYYDDEMTADDMKGDEDKGDTIVEDKRFHLVVATFMSEGEARKFIDTYSTDLSPLYLVRSAKMSRVSMASSDSKEELQEMLNSPKVREMHPTAWIWGKL